MNSQVIALGLPGPVELIVLLDVLLILLAVVVIVVVRVRGSAKSRKEPLTEHADRVE
jgi:heme/copper-type cytochrome/quinol oxidase subunit 2